MPNNPNIYLNVEVYDKIADCENWAMFTETGNKKVQRIFQQTLQRDRGKYAEEYFLFASKAVDKLSKNEAFGEAMDSEVR